MLWSEKLSGFHLQESRRRALWMEPMPTVESADRLRRLPLFSSLSVNGLFRIAGPATQLRHEPGHVLGQEGMVPDTLHLLLDGKASCKTSAGEEREVRAPAALGFQEILENRPLRETVRAMDTAVTLALGNEECHILMADDTELVQGLFRMLSGAVGALHEGLVFRGTAGERTGLPNAGLKPIEKILVLKTIPVFADVSAEEMPGLAAIAHEIHLETGSVLFREADPPALYAIVAGEISLESPANESVLVASATDAVGILQSLAGVGFGRSGRVTQDGTALRIDREDLFDLMAQRPDLLRQLFSAVFQARAIAAAAATT